MDARQMAEAAEQGDMVQVRRFLQDGISVDAKDSEYGWTALILAAMNGRMDVVKLLVAHGADVNAVDNKGVSALMNAAGQGKTDVVRLLVDHGADVHAVTKDGTTILMEAAEWGTLDIVRLVVDRGAGVNAVTEKGKTALMCAAQYGSADVVPLLIDRGADLNAIDHEGNTALLYASIHNTMDVLQHLVDRGASVNTAANNGRTALMILSMCGPIDKVRLLLDRGATLDAVNEDGETALMYASARSEGEIARLLVDRGADVNAIASSDGKTALMVASKKGRIDGVRCLVDGGAGADVNAVDNDGMTPLMHALEQGNTDTAQLLVALGADVNAVDNNGTSSLMYAAEEGSLDIVRLLADRGADLDAVANDGTTALLYASKQNEKDVVRFLVDRGAGINGVDDNGKTALMYASSKRGDMDIVHLLASRGADLNTIGDDGTALILASRWSMMNIVQFLVAEGADVNAASKTFGMTALMYASKKTKIEIARILIDGGADVNVADNDGTTALMYASMNGRIDTVRLLVDRGANINAVGRYDMTALLYASEQGKVEIVHFLVDQGAEVNAVESEIGMTALLYASEKVKIDTARFLVEHGADVNAADKKGKSALMYMAKRNNTEIVRLLLGRGADMNAVDTDGTPVLMYSSQRYSMDFVILLVNEGALVSAADKNGKTILMHASEGGEMNAIRLLIDRGADINAVDNDGTTALMYASGQGNADAVRFLVDRGADVSATNKAGKSAVYLATSNGHSAVQHLLIPLLHVTTTTAISSRATQSPTSTSWFISPFVIELKALIDRQDAGVQFRASWLDADVVVKLFVPDASMSTFADEVTTWRQLRHPNVIKLYGACEVGHYFFVSEFASNGSLVEHLAACRSSGVVCTPWKFLHETALGLVYLHERNMVHGNLRGSNILIGSDGVAKLSEFALGGASKRGATKERLLGSERWQPPERDDGGEATFASDVYSLGMCVVEAVSGKVPWTDTSIGWKSHWVPIPGVFIYRAPALLADDVTDLLSNMCDLKPELRIAASVAAQMLGRWAAKEQEEHQQAAQQQPDPEPQVNIDEFKDGELRRLWDKIQDLMAQCAIDDFHRHAFDEVQAIHKRLGRASQPWKLLEQFHQLLIEVESMVSPNAYQSQIHRSSSTGFSMVTIRRHLDIMWAEIEGPQIKNEGRTLQWREQRAKQLNVFVSEVEQTLLSLNELDTEEDRLALVAILKSEIDDRGSDYTPAQLSVIQKAYDRFVQPSYADAVTAVLPEWFLPWYELKIDNATCVGTGGFGGVYRARWLESEVVVKMLTPVGASSSRVDSFASMASWYSVTLNAVTGDPSGQEAKRKMRDMFAREVSIWFGLSHPHVVRLFGACHIGTQFFACEYAANGSLDKYLRQHPDELWHKLHEAALGVQYLHSLGIVHGDLKCNNILVGNDGKAKVTDFGLSSDAALLDKAETQVSGAWQWVAPECLEHGASRLSLASDVYALGMCVIEALRVVALTVLKLDAIEYPPLPWGSLDNVSAKYHAVRKRELPLRPQLCTDEQWALVTRMCASDPSGRLKISTVVSELSKLARVGRAEENEAKLTATSQEPVAMIVMEGKSQTDPSSSAGSKEHKVLQQIFNLLWDRLEILASTVGSDGGDVECLRELVKQVQEGTTALQDTHDTLLEFTQTAMRGYALHRDLDKLIEANFWRIGIEEGDVHDWKSRCSQFLDWTGEARYL